MRRYRTSWVGLAVVVSAIACGSDDDSGTPADAAPSDAAVDAASDPVELPLCGLPLPCPQASGPTTTICGQLHDLESDAPIGATEGVATRCDPSETTASGPCSFKLELYDLLSFSQGSTTQLGYDPDDLVYDSCGRFRVTGLAAAGSGITAVAARGAVISTIAVRVSGGGTAAAQRLYTVSPETNVAWSEQVGREDLRTDGVYVSIHRVPPTLAPAAGVVLTGATGGSGANYYFDDTLPDQRSSIEPGQSATGSNGTALLLDQPSIATFASSGGELPDGCNWNTVAGGNIAGAYFIQVRVPFVGSSTVDVCSP
jgi:hypothetical protein